MYKLVIFTFESKIFLEMYFLGKWPSYFYPNLLSTYSPSDYLESCYLTSCFGFEKRVGRTNNFEFIFSFRCIMAPASSKMEPTFWSSCSLEYLALAFEHGMDYCLRNKPTTLFDGPVCGNGFVEQVTSPHIRRYT